MNPEFRQQFPILQRQHRGKSLVFLDGPAGTQVPSPVIDAMSDYYRTSNANTHGAFLTTRETDDMMEATRTKMAAFLGAAGPECISFGQNMTTLNFSLSRAIGRVLQPGDEVLITQLDHEGNRGPWLALRDQGIIVREVRLTAAGVLDYDDLERKLNERTRLVAMGWASNILGTINDVMRVRAMTYQTGAWLLLDAVHYAPHFSMDVQAVGCDFLLCSVYKYYGPHVGILYAKPGLLDRLPADRLRTAYQHAPYSIETGTLNHAAIAGVGAAVDFIASLGAGKGLRKQLVTAMERIRKHENALFRSLYQGLAALKGIQIYGPDADVAMRAPTISFTVENMRAESVCSKLADRGIFAWDGHFYALRAVEVLGLLEQGGVTRMGISAYTKQADVDATLAAMGEMVEKIRG